MNLKAALAMLATVWLVSTAAQAAPPPGLLPLEGRVIWVDFWASWCVPCRRSFPWLNEMQQKYGAQGLQIVGVNVDKDRALADAFLDEVPAEFALRFDPAGALAKEFGVQAMPSSYLLAADGSVLKSHFGFRAAEKADYEQAIKGALERASAKP